MRSAASRGFSTIHSRSVTSASSAAYSVALSSGTWANVLSDFLAPGACCQHLLEGDAGVPEVPLGERIHAVLPRPSVERVGEQHGVVEGRELDAVPAQHETVVLEVLPDLEDRTGPPAAASAAASASPIGTCCRSPSPKSKPPVADAMPERHVAGPAGRDRQREADELGLHRVEAGRLGVEGETAGGASLRDPRFELRQLVTVSYLVRRPPALTRCRPSSSVSPWR